MDRISLWYYEGASDKTYEAEIVPVSDGFQVNFAYGRRGGTMNTGTKTSKPVPYVQAKKIFDTLVHAKLAKGYEPMGAPIKVFTGFGGDKRAPSGYKPQLLNAIEEADLEMYFKDPGYMMQEKMDGERLMAKKLGGDIFGINRKGEVVPLPEQIAAEMRKLPDCVLDGEQVGRSCSGSTAWSGKARTCGHGLPRCDTSPRRTWDQPPAPACRSSGLSPRNPAQSVRRDQGAQGGRRGLQAPRLRVCRRAAELEGPAGEVQVHGFGDLRGTLAERKQAQCSPRNPAGYADYRVGRYYISPFDLVDGEEKDLIDPIARRSPVLQVTRVELI